MSQFPGIVPMTGLGDNPLQIENEVMASQPTGGIIYDMPIGFNDWVLSTGAQLGVSTGSAPFRAAVETILGIRFDHGSTTAGIYTTFKLPGEYDPRWDEFQVIATMRYSGSGSDANPGMRASMSYFQPGYANPTINKTTVPATTNLIAGEATLQTLSGATTTSRTAPQTGFLPAGTYAQNYLQERHMPALQASPDITAFYDFTFNFSLGTPAKISRGTSDINVLKPLSIVQLSLAPSVDIGASNNLDLLGTVVRFRRNLALNARSTRFNRTLIR